MSHKYKEYAVAIDGEDANVFTYETTVTIVEDDVMSKTIYCGFVYTRLVDLHRVIRERKIKEFSTKNDMDMLVDISSQM